MIRAAVEAVERTGATHGYTVLDRAHLSRMTFNDRSLEQEVLQLFERQAELLMARMRKSAPPAIATLAHTLKGSRRAGCGRHRTGRGPRPKRLRRCNRSTRAGRR